MAEIVTENGESNKERRVKLEFQNWDDDDGSNKDGSIIWALRHDTKNSNSPGTYCTLGFRSKKFVLMHNACWTLLPLKMGNETVYISVKGSWRGNHCDIRRKRQITILRNGRKVVEQE